MLRGLQDTRAPMLYAAAGYWGIGMTTSLALAFSAGFGGVGIWMGLAAGVVAVAVALMARWLRRERLGLIS
jgi:MATE family multidrug resistance protein